MEKVINLKCLCANSGVSYPKAVTDFKREPSHRNLTAKEKESLSDTLDEAVAHYKSKFLQ